jgi:hypothetical protein
MGCHETQYSQETVERLMTGMRPVLKGEMPMTAMIPQPPTSDLFR